MSWQALDWASKQKTGNGTNKLVLISLANYADDANTCFPSFKTLVNIDRKSVVQGKSVDLGGRRIIKKKKTKTKKKKKKNKKNKNAKVVIRIQYKMPTFCKMSLITSRHSNKCNK